MSQSEIDQALSESGDSVLAFCLALLRRESADLAAIVEAWPALPDAIRRAITSMVEASR